MSPARIASCLQQGTWLPGDGPAMRACFSAPCGLWLRMCTRSSVSRIVGGLDVARQRSE